MRIFLPLKYSNKNENFFLIKKNFKDLFKFSSHRKQYKQIQMIFKIINSIFLPPFDEGHRRPEMNL